MEMIRHEAICNQICVRRNMDLNFVPEKLVVPGLKKDFLFIIASVVDVI